MPVQLDGNEVSFTPTQLGMNAASVPASGSRTSSTIDVRGIRRVGLLIQSDRNFQLYLLGRIGGNAANSAVRYNGSTGISLTGTGGSTYLLVHDLCCEDLIINFVNQDASNAATVTINMTALA